MICSTLKLVTPTVSAASSPFSLPIRNAKSSIRERAVAACLTDSSS